MVTPPQMYASKNNDSVLFSRTSGSESKNYTDACTCSCHFCHHYHHHSYELCTSSSRVKDEIVTNEEDHREYVPDDDKDADDISATTDKMTCIHSQITAAMWHRTTNCSLEESSSFSRFKKGMEKRCEIESCRCTKAIVSTGINYEKCGTKTESLSGDELEHTSQISSSSSSASSSGTDFCNCNICELSGSVIDRSNDKRGKNHVVEGEEFDDTHLVKTCKNYRCPSFNSVCCSSYTNVLNSSKCFISVRVDKNNKTNNQSNGNSDYQMESSMEENGRNRAENGCPTTRLQSAGGRLSLFYASLLFLSLVGRTCSFSILDDEDDEFGGGMPHYSLYPRYRRSAEQFSSLHDALSLIPSNYSIHEPPPTNNSEATQVDFSVLIMNVRDIKELNEGYGDLELSLEMNLRIYWKDTRLSHLADRSGNKFIVLNPVLLDKLWHPDIFIDHVKGVAQPALISKPASLRVYPDSSVRYSARITVTMACQMDFHYYPADTQRCSVDMKSYAYSSKILALDWREGKGALLVEYLELPNFDVALDTTQNFMVNTSSGSYSGIRFTILLRRKLSYHLIQTYLPSTLFIIVSWLSFLVPPESVPGRMALCMTTLLTLTAMFSAVRQNTPNVSYVKALDIWMVVCIIFVFLTLVEYTVLLKLKSKKTKPRPPVSAHPPEERVVASAQTQQQQPTQSTRWTIPSLQYTSDSAKFRGCKNTDGIITENGNGTNGEMRHRENGENGAASGDNVNINTMNIPSAPSSAHPPPLPSPSPPPPPPTLGPGERPLNKYELAAKKIEKFTSAVIPTLFVIFQFIYWPWLINSSEYYHQDKSTTIFKSM